MQVEIDEELIPEGWEVDAFRVGKPNEVHLMGAGRVWHLAADYSDSDLLLILRRKRPRRWLVEEIFRDPSETLTTSNGEGWLYTDTPTTAVKIVREIFHDPPCHLRPQTQWCDNKGPGDFMGHTCK